MEYILSALAIAVLLTLMVVSLRRQHAGAANEDAELQARIGSDDAQRQRSAAHRAQVRAQQD